MKKILIVGGSSLLGYKISNIANEYEVYSTFHKNKIHVENIKSVNINITDRKSCEKILELKPDIIVNSAAMTNVDYCEKFQEEAYEVNVIGTKNLSEISESINCKFVHISSDAIFSGENKSFVEEDIPKPVNVYGKTKLESEKIASKISNCLILRPSVIFGWIPLKHLKTREKSIKTMNFALWLIKKLQDKQKVSIVNDQFSTPTLADNLAENILEFIKKDLTGIFHVAGLSCVSRLDFSKKITKEFGYSDNNVNPCTTKELNQIAPRSLRSCLNSEKALSNGIKLLELDQAIKIMSKQIKKENPQMFGNYNVET